MQGQEEEKKAKATFQKQQIDFLVFTLAQIVLKSRLDKRERMFERHEGEKEKEKERENIDT